MIYNLTIIFRNKTYKVEIPDDMYIYDYLYTEKGIKAKGFNYANIDYSGSKLNILAFANPIQNIDQSDNTYFDEDSLNQGKLDLCYAYVSGDVTIRVPDWDAEDGDIPVFNTPVTPPARPVDPPLGVPHYIEIRTAGGNVLTEESFTTQIIKMQRVYGNYAYTHNKQLPKNCQLFGSFIPDNGTIYQGVIEINVSGNSVSLINSQKQSGVFLVGVL